MLVALGHTGSPRWKPKSVSFQSPSSSHWLLAYCLLDFAACNPFPSFIDVWPISKVLKISTYCEMGQDVRSCLKQLKIYKAGSPATEQKQNAKEKKKKKVKSGDICHRSGEVKMESLYSPEAAGRVQRLSLYEHVSMSIAKCALECIPKTNCR